MFLMGSFIALPAFQDAYGIDDGLGGKVIETKWQSALQASGPLGALIGVFAAGPITSWIGYRWATIAGLMMLNACIFCMYFANSLPIYFLSQLLEGIPWGIFIANAPAYCSEIVPMRLRAPATQVLQLFWAIGAIIVGAVSYVYSAKSGSVAYRLGIRQKPAQVADNLESPSLCSGCFLLLSPCSSSLLLNRLGGSSEKAAWHKQQNLSSASVDDLRSTRTSQLP